MKTSQLYKHCSPHNGKFTWQLSILGFPCRTSAHFNTAEEAAVSVDLVKHHLRTEYRLDLPNSLDGEQFSSLAYSRRGVIMSDCLSVLKSIPEDTKDFLSKHRADLEAHRDSAPPETVASKFRRSGMIEIPAIKEWVNQLELAEMHADSFSKINSKYFFSLLDSLSNRLTDALKPLRLAVKMHDSVTDALLVQRRETLATLVNHIELNLEYVKNLAEDLRAEQASVESAVATLEANRPNLS